MFPNLYGLQTLVQPRNTAFIAVQKTTNEAVTANHSTPVNHVPDRTPAQYMSSVTSHHMYRSCFFLIWK